MEKFIYSRTLKAPRQLVFDAWTKAEHLGQWWGPKGLGLEILALDVRPGGMFHYAMVPPGGRKMYGRFIFQEVDAPRKLAYIVSFADAEANAIRPPFPDPWPVEMMNVVTFEETADGTLVTLTGNAHNASPEEIRTYTNNFKSMEGGFGGTFDKLEEYLATLSTGA
jgi:uncharacterized protein YndB with AHSA1/START domain